MTQPVFQYRPRDSGELTPYYAPARDIGNMYAPLLREVFTSLEPARWPAYLREWLEQSGVGTPELQAVIDAVHRTNERYMRGEPAVISAAIAEGGFDQLNVAARTLFFERLGWSLYVGMLAVLRERAAYDEVDATRLLVIDGGNWTPLRQLVSSLLGITETWEGVHVAACGASAVSGSDAGDIADPSEISSDGGSDQRAEGIA